MKELVDLMEGLYISIVKNGFDKYIYQTKDVLFSFIQIQKNCNISMNESFKILSFLNLISIFNIDDYELNRLIFETRLILISFEVNENNEREKDQCFNIYDQTMFEILKDKLFG